MNKMQLAALAILSIAAVQARANLTYDVTFQGNGTVANGQIILDNGVAVGGYLDVTAGAAQGAYSLYTWTGGGISSIRVGGGTDLIVDNLVNPGGSPMLDIYGLAFYSNAKDGGGVPLEGIDLSLNYGTTYNLAGFGADGYGNPNADGSVAITASSVPEPSTIFAGILLLIPLCLGSVRALYKSKLTD
ncbi:MAG: hypothetical protein P4L61_02440 [Candidatus Pacebacteria bacterium]|nr:hypothetical protein [Candidatus Paceibacterota bacterium]